MAMVFSVLQLGQQPATGAAAANGGAMPPVPESLLVVDVILAVLAGCVLLAALGARLRGRAGLSLSSAPTRPNTVREDALALAVACYFIAVLVLSGSVKAAGMTPTDSKAGLIVGSGAQVIGVLACLMIAARRFEGGARAYLFGLPETRARRPLLWTLGISFVAIGLCPVIAELSIRIMIYLVPTFKIQTHPTLLALQEEGASFAMYAALWTGAAVIAPLAEELFFRGLVQTMLGHLFEGRWTPIVLTAVAFGLVHYPQPHAVPALVVLAILIGYAYERTGSLVAPVLIHALFNLKTLLWEAISGWSV